MPLDEELATLGGNVSNGILVVMTLLLSQVYRLPSEETIEEDEEGMSETPSSYTLITASGDLVTKHKETAQYVLGPVRT